MSTPSTEADIDRDQSYVRSVFPEIDEIHSPELRSKVTEIWVEVWKESGWQRIEDVPKNPKNVAGRPLCGHIRSVTQQALATAEIVRRQHGIEYDRDVLLAASLLHDVSKLVEYEPSGGGASASSRGQLIQHAVYGAHKAWEKELPDPIVHIIVSHTHSSGKRPSTWECIVVHYVDYLDSDALLWREGQPLLLG